MFSPWWRSSHSISRYARYKNGSFYAVNQGIQQCIKKISIQTSLYTFYGIAVP